MSTIELNVILLFGRCKILLDNIEEQEHEYQYYDIVKKEFFNVFIVISDLCYNDIDPSIKLTIKKLEEIKSNYDIRLFNVLISELTNCLVG